ncbi:hypothetical protein APHAL10511_001881 [Amanita phalloides]|nr:hypothetical protein APHAL10511_001881 [Amanita phalloides]
MHPSPVHSPDAFAAPACTRRRASISYNPPPRDRSNKQRPLVVVVPPSILLHQYGLLGHTLSLGPSQRLAHGIVMPLYPTMYAQLTAIAREYNFPSTVGLCLYLHCSDSALTVTPRISDETWHSLWYPAFDGPPPPSRVVPIFGTIEFDVDLRYARWYPSWVSSSQRDIPDSASDCHRRFDSRTTIYDERADDRRESYLHHTVPSVPSQRRFPKKLSLLENTANTKMSLQSSSPSPEKPFALAQVLPPIVQESEPRDLRTRVQSWRAGAILEPSPITTTGQSSLVPANALKIEVSSNNILIPKEYSWSITSAGPDDRESVISVDSERLPSIYIEDRLVGSVCSTPSVCTSFGLFDSGFDSPTRGTHILPSPDLAQRAIESVPMTPMTATTWGPPSDPPSPISVSYVPSVDVGHRHTLSPPPTPSTTTSWGAPLSYPPSPLTPSVPVSPDIGCRIFESVDNMLAWPHSWAYCCYSQMPQEKTQRMMRSENDDCRYPHFNIYPAVYPFFDLYPAAAGENTSALFLAKNHSASHATSMIQSSHYPYLHIYPATYPFFDLYPAIAGESSLIFSCMDQSTVDHAMSMIRSSSYPYLQIYPAVYPLFDLYPSVAGESSFTSYVDQPTINHTTSTAQSSHYPYLHIYPAIYPFADLYPAVAGESSLTFSSCMGQSPTDHAILTTQSSSYPYLQIYPTVYPLFDLYPAVAGESSFTFSCMDQSTVNRAIPMIQSSSYPYLQIYPAVYPLFDLYPAAAGESSSYMDQSTASHAISMIRSPNYPYLQIYPDIYPFFDLYPGVAAASSFISLCMNQNIIDHTMSKIQSSQYPYLRIYSSVYPFLDLYPTVAGESSSAYPSCMDQNTVNHTMPLIQSWHYPYLSTCLSPFLFAALLNLGLLGCSVYPLFDLYPALNAESSSTFTDQNPGDHDVSDTQGCQYPYLSIYPAIYPFFELYPFKAEESSFASLTDGGRLNCVVPFTQKSHYPYLNIYPAVYPFFDLYPALIKGRSLQTFDHALQNCHYPYLNIYPAVYPFFDIYPNLNGNFLSTFNLASDTASTNRPVSITLEEYPSFNLYPSCYPFLNIYPSTSQKVQLSPRFGSPDATLYPNINSSLSIYSHPYPVFNLYPAVYPHFDLYPAVARSNSSRIDPISHPPVSNYPSLVIYRPVYPHFDLCPSITAEVLQIAEHAEPILKPTYPFIDIYPPVYPRLTLYPTVDLPNIYLGSAYSDVNPSFDTLAPALLRSRYTRAELHEQVSKERLSKNPGRKKSHQDLHFTVFPDGFVSTPSGTIQPLVESYIVPDADDFTSLFKAALQVQVINLST